MAGFYLNSTIAWKVQAMKLGIKEASHKRDELKNLTYLISNITLVVEFILVKKLF